MNQAGPGEVIAAFEATWPAASVMPLGPFELRRSPGGGRRVTAATVPPGVDGLADFLPRAEAQMRSWGQTPIFRILPDTPGLDALLESRGYQIADASMLYVAPVEELAAVPTPRMTTFAHWPPLAIQEDIWAEGGIDRDRLKVMARVAGPHISLMARWKDQPVGAAFAAVHGRVAMIHAIEIRPSARRQGNGARLMSRAAQWAAGLGAEMLGLAVTEANVGARALYQARGMVPAGRYHYRVAP